MNISRFLHVALVLASAAIADATPSPDVAQLARDLSDPQLAVRRSATEKLANLGEPAQAAVPSLVKALADQDDLVRRNAAWALGKIRRPHDLVVSALIAKLHDEKEDWSVHHNAALSLSWVGEPAVPALRQALKAGTPWTRAYAADALMRIGGQEKLSLLVPIVGDLLASPDMKMRAFAATLAGRLGRQADPLAEKLAALLDDKEIDPRINGIKALLELGPGARSVLPRIKQALREDKDQWVRIGAVQVLGASQDIKPDTIHLLTASLADEKDRVAAYAAQSIAAIGEPAVPALIEALKSEKSRVRVRAAEAFALMGPATGKSAEAAQSFLISALGSDKEWEVRSLSAAALGALGSTPEKVVSALEAALRDDHEIVRLNAGDALKKLGRTPPEAPVNEPARRT